MLIALAIAVATWVGGFDILYALQDISFDRENGLYSVPSTFGEANALGIAQIQTGDLQHRLALANARPSGSA